MNDTARERSFPPAPASRPSGLHVVVGASGQVGAHVVSSLLDAGARVRGVMRSAAPGRPQHEVERGDIGDPQQAQRLCRGAHVVYACFGGAHRTWHEQFPRMTGGLLAGAAQAGARVVFADNLYAYGPQSGVLTEETPLEPAGPKQRLRAEIAELFLAAHRRGDTLVAIARASDLYGPEVRNAMLSTNVISAAMKGQTVRLPGNLHAPHTFTFAPDFARALVRLATSSCAWGEVWHVPSAPALSLAEVVGRIGSLSGTHPHVAHIPTFLLQAASLVNRPVRELLELSFQWNAPYIVSHTKFTTRFGLESTSMEQGLRQTMEELRIA